MDGLFRLSATALYLDVDGTLVPLAARPGQVFLPPSTARLLLDLHAACGGALALISGRDRDSLLRVCSDLSVPMISSHGAAMHAPDGREYWNATVDPGEHRNLEQAVAALIHPYSLVWMEHKAHGVAVHFRQRPELDDELHAALTALCSAHPGFTLMRGHCVIELRLAGYDKGQAISRAQDQAPFAGRKPVMIGDDLTDEAAFRLVNQHHGVSIRIGTREPHSAARFYLQDPSSLLTLLHDCVRNASPSSRLMPQHPSSVQVAAP